MSRHDATLAVQRSLKRVFDVILSACLLFATFPLMAFIALLVKLDSKGPVFYRQVRVGENRRSRHSADARERRSANVHGRRIVIYKFRSMRVDAEADGRAVWCSERDPRVTRFGALLRQTHLDELPQLINVLRGDMSLVGPRPERPEFVPKLVAHVPGYERRMCIKPGLTGLAQVRHRADVNLGDVKKKVRYDLLYLRRFSIMTDLKILLATVPLALGLTAERLRGRSRRIIRLETGLSPASRDPGTPVPSVGPSRPGKPSAAPVSALFPQPSESAGIR